jgi:flagellar secretion chaperone FliS
MSARDSAFAYLHAAAVGASPVGQIIALYDTILRDLRRALCAIDAKEIEHRVNETNHALTIIGELQGVLDFEQGGEAAKNLNAFYEVMRAKIMQASIASSHEQCEEVISCFTRIRAAWAKIEPKIPRPTEHGERLRISSPPRVVPQSDPVAADSSSSDNGNGHWRG